MRTMRKRQATKRLTIEALENRCLLSADLTGGFIGRIPLALPPQGSNSISVAVSNVGDLKAVGSATVNLYASTDQVLDGGDMLLGSKTARLSLAAGKKTTVPVKFASPSTLASGSYYILAEVQGDTAIADANAANNVVATQTAVQIHQPFVDLTAAVTKLPKGTIAIGGKGQRASSFTAAIINNGNVPAKGLVSSRILRFDRQDSRPGRPEDLHQQAELHQYRCGKKEGRNIQHQVERGGSDRQALHPGAGQSHS